MSVRTLITAKPILPRSQDTIVETGKWLSTDTQVPSLESVIFHLNPAIVVIERRKIERIARYLSPMFPSHQDIMVVVFIDASDVVWERRGTIVIDRTTLIFRIEILNDDILQPSDLTQL
jgi:hypothetical protein